MLFLFMQSTRFRIIRLTEMITLELPRDAKILKTKTVSISQNYRPRQSIIVIIQGDFESMDKYKKVKFRFFGDGEEIPEEFMNGYLNSFELLNQVLLHLYTNCYYILSSPVITLPATAKRKTTKKKQTNEND